jgi:O-methyltransferase involved in polyketide biosynthesis
MEKTELFNHKINDVSTTLLITLYCRALESQSRDPILNDPKAVEITRQLNPELAKSDNKFYQNLAKGKLDQRLVVHIALRAKRYDRYVKDFLNKSPDGIVVNIGSGLDTRFHRIGNGQVTVYDLDFPEVIEIKKNFLVENPLLRPKL